MKNYESTKIKQVLESPTLSQNYFKEIFDEFDLYNNNNDIINEIKNKNKNNKINNVFLPNNEMYISFGKNYINNQDLSPIPISSSDSQKDKLSLISDNKEPDNFVSPLPINDLNFPIIKDINNFDSNTNDKEINNMNNKKENKWKKLTELLILNRLRNNIFNDIKKIPKMILIKLIISNNKNKLINQNIPNNTLTNNNISIDMKNSFEQSTKIEIKTHIKMISDNSLDDIVEDSNFYNVEKEKNEDREDKEYIYEPTNAQNLLNINLDPIFDVSKLNSMVQELDKIDKIYENIDNNNNNFMHPIKEEPDEEIYEQESRNLSMKNNSLQNNLVLSKNKEIKENFNNFKDINDKEVEEKDNKEIDIIKGENKESKKSVQDFSEFFQSQPTNLNYIEQKLNNQINQNLNKNKEEKKGELYLKTPSQPENLKNDIYNDKMNEKNTFSKLPYENDYNFSFGIKDFNNNNNKENNKISSNIKNFVNSINKEEANNELFTFDKNKNKTDFGKEDFEKELLINKSKNKDDMNNSITILNQKNNDNNQLINTESSNSKKFDKILEKLSPLKDDQNNRKKINDSYKENNKNFENTIYNYNKKNDTNTNANKNNVKFLNNDEKIFKTDNTNNYCKNNRNEKEENNSSFNNLSKEINYLNNDEKIIIDESFSNNGNQSKKKDYSQFIKSPECSSSVKSVKKGLDPNISIRSNLFNINPKIITINQINNLRKLHPKINLSINDKNINKNFFKYFLNGFNNIIFRTKMNDTNINKNIHRIQLKSYLNILGKIIEKDAILYDEFVEYLINETSEQIEILKKYNKINNNQLKLNKGKKNVSKKENDAALNNLFSNLNSKLWSIKYYYVDETNKISNKNNIHKLREDLKYIFEKLITYINKVYKKSVNEKIYYYQKIVDELLMLNVNKKELKISIDKLNAKLKIKSILNNPLIIGGILLPFIIIFFLLKILK